MPTRAYVDVADLLLGRVRAGAYAVGDRLPSERQLAEELGVSRPTVREALAALELQGVVDTHLGAGTYVRGLASEGEPVPKGGPTDASPSEVLQARLLIEPGTTRLAAVNWERQTLAAVARPLRNVERAADAGSAAHPTNEDRQFHTAIARAAGNEVLFGLLTPLWAMMSQSLWRTLKERGWTAEHTRMVAVEHREIYEAIRSRDGDLAAFTMEKHIRGVISSLYLESN
jgi:DNA-binding FadR family transcriptional regulator